MSKTRTATKEMQAPNVTTIANYVIIHLKYFDRIARSRFVWEHEPVGITYTLNGLIWLITLRNAVAMNKRIAHTTAVVCDA